MSGSYAAGADADAGGGGGGANEDEDGYDDKHHDGGVKLARSNTVNENNDGTAMDKEGGPDAKNPIRLRGIVTFSFPLSPLPSPHLSPPSFQRGGIYFPPPPILFLCVRACCADI